MRSKKTWKYPTQTRNEMVKRVSFVNKIKKKILLDAIAIQEWKMFIF